MGTKTKRGNTHNSGFTLVELISVIAILGIIAAIGTTNFTGVRNQRVLSDEADKIAANIRDSLERSKSQLNGEQWGIRFDNTSSGNNDFYEIWSGTNYDSKTSSEPKNYLPGGVEFLDPSDGSSKDIVFAATTGVPDASATIIIKHKSLNKIEVITVNSIGVVSIGLEDYTEGSQSQPDVPFVTTLAPENVTTDSAVLTGGANPNSSAATGWFRYDASDPGTCNDTFGIRVPATGGTNLGSGSATVPFSEGISGLSDATTYYYCAIAENNYGKSFGNIVSFTTAAAPAVGNPPAVTTDSVDDALVTNTSAYLGGKVTSDTAPTSGWFRYGSSNISCGNLPNVTTAVSVSTGSNVSYSTQITGLTAGNTYYYCAVAANPNGTDIGDVLSFTAVPTGVYPTNVTTDAASYVLDTTATLNGSANPNGVYAVGQFRIDTTKPGHGQNGSCDNTFGTPVGSVGLGSGTTQASYSYTISTLTLGTTYYYCAIAENVNGTSIGSPVESFTTINIDLGGGGGTGGGSKCICIDLWSPVTCSDGVTYSNSCRAKCAGATGCVGGSATY